MKLPYTPYSIYFIRGTIGLGGVREHGFLNPGTGMISVLSTNLSNSACSKVSGVGY